MEQDVGYYARRAAEERQAARDSTSEQARQRHFELAAAYELRVRDLEARQRRSSFGIITAA